MVPDGRWSLVPGLLLDMHACVELNQIGASVTLLIPTVLVLEYPHMEQLQQQQYPHTHTLDLCSQLRTMNAGTFILSSVVLESMVSK